MGLFTKWFAPPTRERFAEMMTNAVRRNAHTGAVEFDPERFSLRLSSDTTHTLYLENAYRDYCAASRYERKNVLRNYSSITSLRDNPQAPLDSAKANLLPRVRERFYYGGFDLNRQLESAARPDGKPLKPLSELFLLRPMNEHLTVEVVLDLPTAIQTVAKKQLDDWGLNLDEALVIAKDNLWRMSNKDFQRVTPGLYVSPWQDTHDCSRIYLHDLIWQLEVKGQHVAAIPNRNQLIVTGSEDAENLQGMAALIEEVMTQPRPMTARVFRLDGSQWVPFLPPPESPAYLPLRRALLLSTGRDYAEQTNLLNAVHKKTGLDVFVANVSVVSDKNGSVSSWTTWVGPTIDEFIGEADVVAFGRMIDGKLEQDGFAAWALVMKIVGHRMEKLDLYPPRYRVRSYPTKAELDAMELREEPF